jgi:hypothetical protein
MNPGGVYNVVPNEFHVKVLHEEHLKEEEYTNVKCGTNFYKDSQIRMWMCGEGDTPLFTAFDNSLYLSKGTYTCKVTNPNEKTSNVSCSLNSKE